MNEFKKLSRTEMQNVTGGMSDPTCNVGNSCFGNGPGGQFFSSCMTGTGLPSNPLCPEITACGCYGWATIEDSICLVYSEDDADCVSS